jgi:acyl-coenzyme A thioesterase PaaI-like protein
MTSPGQRILSVWQRLSPLPGGRWLFLRALGRFVPYSASVRPRVLSLEPGHARIAMRDRRAVRNHLQSIHAVALINVAELASGLAMTTALPSNVRGIVTRIRMEYLKKARGTVVAESSCTVPSVTEDEEHDFATEIRDADGDVVARAAVTWKLGPARTAETRD